MNLPSLSEFEPFSLERLLKTCFELPSVSLKPCILIDLPDVQRLIDFSFLEDTGFTVQKRAVYDFLNPLNAGIGDNLNLQSCDLFAFPTTGGSNLDPEGGLLSLEGKHMDWESDLCTSYDLILAITDFSLTAPLTAYAKKYGFRGATLHGVNEIILNSGLSVDYMDVSRQAESYRLALDHAEKFVLTFECLSRTYELTIECAEQSAQKSHGLCPTGTPDVANLPAGEVYFVPTGAEGSFPFRFGDGTLAEMIVEKGAIQRAVWISGDTNLIEQRNHQLQQDPATGIIGELGFGTQLLPVSGRDIQDEKILGTCHIATGRSDHLGGDLTPSFFKSRINATHDDILYAPFKTPEISVSKVVMQKMDQSSAILENFAPTSFLIDQLSPDYGLKLV